MFMMGNRKKEGKTQDGATAGRNPSTFNSLHNEPSATHEVEMGNTHDDGEGA